MAEGFINVTEGSGKKLHTFDRTIGANTVHDELVLAGIPYYASYHVVFSGISLATAGSHVLQIMAGGSLNVYLMGIVMWQAASATTAAYIEWSIRRLSTAGTGGASTGAPPPLDAADGGSGATAMTLPTVKGTEGSVPWRSASYLVQTPGAAGAPMLPILEYPPRDAARGLYKPIRIPAGTTNGIAFRNDTGHAGATVTGTATIIEANF